MKRDRHEDDRLSAFLDDELDDRTALAVTRHVADCDRCFGELEALRATRSALRGLPNLDPPETMFSDVMAVAGTVDPERWRRTLRYASAAIAGSALIGAAVFLAGGDDAGTVVPPLDVFVADHVARTGGGPVITPVDLGR